MKNILSDQRNSLPSAKNYTAKFRLCCSKKEVPKN